MPYTPHVRKDIKVNAPSRDSIFNTTSSGKSVNYALQLLRIFSLLPHDQEVVKLGVTTRHFIRPLYHLTGTSSNYALRLVLQNFDIPHSREVVKLDVPTRRCNQLVRNDFKLALRTPTSLV